MLIGFGVIQEEMFVGIWSEGKVRPQETVSGSWNRQPVRRSIQLAAWLQMSLLRSHHRLWLILTSLHHSDTAIHPRPTVLWLVTGLILHLYSCYGSTAKFPTCFSIFFHLNLEFKTLDLHPASVYVLCNVPSWEINANAWHTQDCRPSAGQQAYNTSAVP